MGANIRFIPDKTMDVTICHKEGFMAGPQVGVAIKRSLEAQDPRCKSGPEITMDSDHDVLLNDEQRPSICRVFNSSHHVSWRFCTFRMSLESFGTESGMLKNAPTPSSKAPWVEHGTPFSSMEPSPDLLDQLLKLYYPALSRFCRLDGSLLCPLVVPSLPILAKPYNAISPHPYRAGRVLQVALEPNSTIQAIANHRSTVWVTRSSSPSATILEAEGF
ncbi:hypothetical protein C8R45DRAFT_926390 [Mycena sanguinolenta]|nr:hypothetical protein C8R45DRAFT_926390 [Mycena sanguinolenta]